MTSKRAVIAMTIGLVIAWFLKAPTYDNKPNGTCDKRLESIKKEYIEMLSHEKEGLALAVYKDDKLLLDLWGGYAERAAMRLWNKDTITVAFSATKIIGAFIVAILASRGHINYDDLVVKYWPEFGAHGKENITVLWVVEHQAGLIKFDGELSLEQTRDHRYISKLIEGTKPMWPPGTAIGYHAITYGWLLDQLVRRADPKHRGLAQFYRDEIHAHMDEKDFYLGVPRSEQYRVARIVQITPLEFIRAIITTPRYAEFALNVIRNFGNCLMCISGKYPLWMSVLSIEMPYNDPLVREVENVAVVGVGTARALANVVSTVWKKKLISEKIWKRLRKPTSHVMDKVSALVAYRGHGFLYSRHPTKPESYLMFHGGHGMQNVIFDPDDKVVMALLRNGLLWDMSAFSETLLLAGSVISNLKTK